MDVRDTRLREVFMIERPDVINHHAAQMNVRRSVSDPLFDAQVNIVGSLNLIECAKEFETSRFIYISTGGAVYGEPVYLPCDEKHPINPICQYGASKHTVEHYLYMYYHNYGLKSIVLRYPNVYGPRQDPNGEAGVVAIFTGQMLAGDQVVVNGDGEQTRDYVYVGDCALANELALIAPIDHGIFNIGSGIGTSVNEILDDLAQLTQYHGQPENGPAKIGETRHIYLDATQAEERLGWQPSISLREGLAQTVEYFRQSEILSAVTVNATEHEGRHQEPDVAERLVANLQLGVPNAEYEHEDPPSSAGVMGTDQKIRWIEDALAGKSLLAMPLEEILKITLSSCRGEGGSVLMIDEQGQLIRAMTSFRDEVRDGQHESLQLLFTNGLAGWVWRQGQPALIEDTSADPRWFQTTREEEAETARSAISVPLVDSGRIHGVLTISRPATDAFSKDDLALLLTASTLLTLNSESFQVR